MAAPQHVINIQDKLSGISELWSPGIVAEANGWHRKAVKVAGGFVRHRHDVDEMFLVVTGQLTIDLDGQPTAHLGEGDVFVVPAGTFHLPRAEQECHVLLLVPAGVANTGDAGGARTVQEQWL